MQKKVNFSVVYLTLSRLRYDLPVEVKLFVQSQLGLREGGGQAIYLQNISLKRCLPSSIIPER